MDQHESRNESPFILKERPGNRRSNSRCRADGEHITAYGGQGPEEHGAHLTRGDAALLRFAAAAEILETDFWVQYNELGGVQDNEFPGGGGSGNPAYTAKLTVLDSDMAQYIHDNTDDEFTHQHFLNA